jgi:hypothetical protein
VFENRVFGKIFVQEPEAVTCSVTYKARKGHQTWIRNFNENGIGGK